MRKINTKNLFLTLGILLGGASSIVAQNRYVSTTGNDATNDCKNINSPCLTISKAVSVSIAGDTVFVASGNYNLASTLSFTTDSIALTSLTATKPVITSSASDLILINAKDISISNMVFKMGLTASTGLRGIVSTDNFAGLSISNNEFYSIKPKVSMNGYVFGSYAIQLNTLGNVITSFNVKNNKIGDTITTVESFGRGIGLGFVDGVNINTNSGVISNNNIVSLYPIQLIQTKQNLLIKDNSFVGTVILGYVTSGAKVMLDNNTFDAVNDQLGNKIYSLLDVRGISTGSVMVSNNDFNNYVNMGVFDNGSREVYFMNNNFNPSPTSNKFISLYVNTKMMTSSAQNTTYSSSLYVQGNHFNSGVADNGTAIWLADHYGAITPAFDTIAIGGPDVLRNTFDVNLGNFIQLDSLAGSSDNFILWNPGIPGNYTPATTMIPMTQNVYALADENYYGGLTDTSAIEAKNIDKLDKANLGKIILGYVSGLGVKNTPSISANIYPNPATDKLSVDLNNNSKATAKIIDVLGNIVYSGEVLNHSSIGIEFLKKGIYFLKVIQNGKSFTTKFIKK